MEFDQTMHFGRFFTVAVPNSPYFITSWDCRINVMLIDKG